MNEYFAQTLASVLEETSTNMGNAMILEHLSTKGTVTLEEAEFYHTLCTDVITEAAEDFIPDTLDVPEQEVAPEAAAPIELFDAVGNKYVFQDGQLIPVEGEVEEEMAPEEAPVEEAPVMEATETEGEVVEEAEAAPVEVVEESTVVAEDELLEESDSVVARILANLK